MGKIYLFTVLLAILLFVQISSIRSQDIFANRGHLLTPEEGCGVSKSSNSKIVGGTEALPGAYPWLALVGQTDLDDRGNKVDSFNCGGSLITSRHVLTAAHCVVSNSVYLVRLGEHDTTKNDTRAIQDIPVIRVAKHAAYSAVYKVNDIAVLTLERDVDFDDRIRPVCLPLTEDVKGESFVDTNPFVAGWGNLQENGVKSNVLMHVQIPVIENEKCKEMYIKNDGFYSRIEFNEAVLCAGNLAGGKATCHGDSGGPLVLPILQNGSFPIYQIGVVSWGTGCARPNAPTIYTRVSYFMDWIKENVNEQ